jgi:hypothetical protein
MVDWDERLREAVRAGSAKRVKGALARGAKLATAFDGSATPLHSAAQGGDAEIVRALLESGGKRLLEKIDDSGRTPLLCAVEAARVEAVRALLAAGADVNARDVYGNTALRTAAAEGTLEMVKLLVAAGANPLIPGRLTLNAIDRAQERKTPEGRMITVFLQRALLERHATDSSRSTRKSGGGGSGRKS